MESVGASGDMVIEVEGTDPHQIRLSQKAFDIGIATVNNAWMWAQSAIEDLRNASHEGKWFRYDGSHIVVSLDGYTYSDCLFRNYGVPRSIVIEVDRSFHMELPPPVEMERLEGEHVLLGDVHNHFGHVLVESINRMWCLNRMSSAERARSTYVFFNTWGALNDSLMVKLLALYDIDIARVKVVDRHISFAQLMVPSPAQRPFHGWNVYYSQTMEDLYHELRERYLQRHKPSLTRTFDKLYLSRGKFVAARRGQRCLEESAMVEQRFSDAGFQIIHPETLAFEDQLWLALHAREIAGPAGSAHHIAAFSTKLERQTILTHPHFIMASADASLTMKKGACLTYFVGTNKSPGVDPLESNWTISPAIFDAWFSKRYCRG